MKQPFETAVQQHGPTVLRVCRAVLGTGPDADDAWQETFLAALRAWPDLDEDTNMAGWLITVAHRKAIDITRSRARSAVPTAHLPEHPVAATEPSDIWSRVAALPERQRLCVAYHYLGGLTHVQTAELVGGTAAAVRRAAADGVAALRAQMSAPTDTEDVR